MNSFNKLFRKGFKAISYHNVILFGPHFLKYFTLKAMLLENCQKFNTLHGTFILTNILTIVKKLL